MNNEITSDQLLQETHLLARQNWREVEHLKALSAEHQALLAQLQSDLREIQQCVMTLRDKLDSACRLVGDLQDMPEGSLRDRVAKLEGRLRNRL